MTTALAVVRATHLGAMVGLVGALGFSLFVLRASPGSAGPDRDLLERSHAALLRTASWCWLVGTVSALAWLALYTAAAAGGGLASALDADALTRVLSRTSFGRLWLVRMAVLVLAGALLLLHGRERDARDWVALRGECFVLGAAVLSLLAWTGHAVTVEDLPWRLAPVIDAAHIVASGVWLGGLLALARFLALLARSPQPDLVRVAAGAVGRFSALAMGAVILLVLTGALNAWALVADIAGLVGTPYGHLLLVKLALLVPLIGLGALNRSRILPRLAAGGGIDAARIIRQLRFSVAAEIGLGGAVLLVVGALGITPPARHAEPWWPFSVRLSWTLARADPTTPLWLGAGALFALAGLASIYLGRRRTASRWPIAAGAALAAYGAVIALFAFPVIDAYPTTYLRPTVPYQASSIARGAELYAKHCAVCHGPSGYGDGPAARTLPREPADLTAKHTADHTAGDLFWWLTHGIPGSGMPGFQGVTSETERWDLINFVRLLAAGEAARRLAPRVGPPLVVAPDFAFGIGVGPGQTVRDYRGRAIVHLVLFTLPDSLARLEEIDRAWTRIGLAGARVIAVPMRDPGEVYHRLGTRLANLPIAVEGSEEAVVAYTWLAQSATSARPEALTHVEFLIDRQGWARARWIPGESPAWNDPSVLLAEIERLDREAPAAPPPEDHVH